jgi:glycosyltransferase involved in cell wall biosynthesis
MPAFKAAQFIGEALESVFVQTRRDFEVIVVNDGSPDRSELERALEPFRSRIVYLSHENRGVSAARNTGIKAARGRFLAFLDPDDIWEPDYLEVQLGILEGDETVDVVYPNASIFGDGPLVGREYMDVCPSDGEVTFESLVEQSCNVMISCVSRREAITAVGMFDEALRSSEDYDLWLRVVKAGYRITYHRRTLVQYRRHSNSQSADALWMYRHVLQTLEKARRTLCMSAEENRAVTEKMTEIAALQALTEGKLAIESGEISEAIEKLDKANEVLDRKKIAVALLLLRIAPRSLKRVVSMWQRVLTLRPELARK